MTGALPPDAPRSLIDAGEATSFLKLLAHEGRLEIMCLLLDGGRTVGEIAQSLGLTQSAVSQQLMRLRAEDLVVAHREGRSIRYVLGRPETAVVVRALRQVFCPVGDATGPGRPNPA